jgi:hypothetical protein
MPLQKRLDDEDLALLEVIEDPILFAEFLRSTADASPHKEEWPKKNFKYRWYQRDLITDKTPYIALTAGRAVGKCNTIDARVFTPTGYRTIGELVRRKTFAVYARDKHNNLVQRRAFATYNGRRDIYTLYTKSQHHVKGTGNHPVLTERGYVQLKELDIANDKVAVATRLPHNGVTNTFNWFELRFLGYIMGTRRGGPSLPFNLKYHKQVAEFEAIAKAFNLTFDVDEETGKRVTLMRKRGQTHFGTRLLEEIGWTSARKNGIRGVPDIIKSEKLENIKLFLEAYFSLHARIDSKTLSITTRYLRMSRDIQELLLYFGIESRINIHYDSDFDDTKHELELLDYRAYYRFFNTFQLPGISVRDLPEPEDSTDPTDWYRFEGIERVAFGRNQEKTWAITVWEDPNYICDNILVHNSLVLEDKVVWESVNSDIAFPETKEQSLLTANTSQMTPILDRLILRFTHSPLLKDFLRGNVNRSKGTLDFPLTTGNYRINARIAGARGENNMIGLHVNKVKVDEAQVFPMPAYTQMLP